MVEPLADGVAERDDARHGAVDQHVHVHADARLELRQFEQVSPSSLRRRRFRARRMTIRTSSADLSRISAISGSFFVEQFGDLLDQPALLHQP